jgi:hypothetical protein
VGILDDLSIWSRPLSPEGVLSYDAFAGGELGQASQQAASSDPGWSSILTGVWRDKHGVSDNAFSGSNFSDSPHFYKRVKDLYPTAYPSPIIHGSPIVEAVAGSVDFRRDLLLGAWLQGGVPVDLDAFILLGDGLFRAAFKASPE